MPVINGQVVLYGVDDINNTLDSIINMLNANEQYFEIKLIMFEAVNNAFVHGNNSDKNKPISIDWEIKENLLKIDVTDCGYGVNNFRINREITEDNILDECGRGLYIIDNYADEVQFEGSSIIMKKYLK
jgi:serine/threonine-protein kinase RsbW